MIPKELREYINWGGYLDNHKLTQEEILTYFDDIIGKHFYSSHVKRLIQTQHLEDNTFIEIYPNYFQNNS